jgi:RNA polymerase sigma-70 factor (ECF subfamily)
MSPDGFGRLALPSLDALYRTARRLTGSDSDAEDLVQQTFLEGFRSVHRLESPARCRAWLFGILRNLWRKGRLRARQRPTLALVDIDADDEILRTTGDPEQDLVRRTFSDEMERALGALPDDFRMAVLLFDVEGLSYAEVAMAMDCKEGTVRSRLARGRGLLAAQLARIERNRATNGGG